MAPIIQLETTFGAEGGRVTSRRPRRLCRRRFARLRHRQDVLVDQYEVVVAADGTSTPEPGPGMNAAREGRCRHSWGAWGVQGQQQSRSNRSIYPSQNGFGTWLPRLDSNQ